jgi:O-antigen/teichoic acid export membrane protein
MISLLAAQGVAAAFGVFAFTRIGRELPVVELGRFGFAVYSTALFGLLAELGIRFVAMKEIATKPDLTWQIYRHSARVRWLTAAISLILLSVIALMPAWRSEWGLLLLGGLLAVTQFGSDPASWVFFGCGRIDIGAIVLIVDRILYLLGIHLAALWMPSAEGLIIGALLANLIRMGISKCLVYLRVNKKKITHWDQALFRKLIMDGIAIGIAILAFVSYSQLTIVLMKTFSTQEQLGYYAMAFGITNVLLVIPTSLIMALFPQIITITEGKQKRCDMITLSTRLTLPITLPIALLLIVFANDILTFWMGVRYSPASLELKILAVTLVFSAISFLCRLFLFAMDNYKAEIAINVTAILITLLFGIPLCMLYGGVGIAALFVFIEICVATTKFMLIRCKREPMQSTLPYEEVL